MLKPLGPDWVAPFPSIQGEAAICRDDDGSLWFATMTEEDTGWVKFGPATNVFIEAMINCQILAGKEPQPWPEGAPPRE